MMKAPIVMKFGLDRPGSGTAMGPASGDGPGDAESLRQAAALARRDAGEGVLVVLSAFSEVTGDLLRCGRTAQAGNEEGAIAELEAILGRHADTAAALLGPRGHPLVEGAIEKARRELSALLRSPSLLGTALAVETVSKGWDLLAGRGEILSSTIFAAWLGLPLVDARSVVRTDSHFGSAKPRPEEIRKLAAREIIPLLGPGKIVITQGSIGSDEAGTPTTLGRDGTDFSASLLGAAIDAAEIRIWTEAEGILACDPRLVPEARPIAVLGYDEAAELAAYGTGILHPATIQPAVEKGIRVTVRSLRSPEGRFTTISRDPEPGPPVTALASRGPVTIITITTPRMLGGSGFLSRIFQVFERRGMEVDLVSTSEVAVSLTLDAGLSLDELVRELSAFAEVAVNKDRAVVALIGREIKKTRGVSGKALGALRDINIEMISLGADEINLSLVIAQEDAREAVARLYAAFFGEGEGEALSARATPVAEPSSTAPSIAAEARQAKDEPSTSLPAGQAAGQAAKEARASDASLLRVGVFGRGRLGSAVASLVQREAGMSLAWCIGRSAPPDTDVDVVLDVSAAAAVPQHLEWALATKVDLVIGATGWDRGLLFDRPAAVEEAGIGILVAPNFSLAVAFMRRAAMALGRLAELDSEAELGVVERHHGGKADAPSGTAKLLAAALAEGCQRYSGWGQGKAEEGCINVASLRSGREIGYHELRFEAASETIVLSHEAKSRDIFARGALRAIAWIHGRHGIFTFDDMATKVIDPLFEKAVAKERRLAQ
ncbi:MAG: aspartate kinase [Rectinemataceae bacterium]